ncbi:MAG: nicotinate-nucleotide adenylyltransferase [Dehalococcoidales bacterium]|nr:nicotinate-nucleotide adenylyltransferase [Dehalococcoidales bacterium]
METLNGGGNNPVKLGILGGTFDPPHNGHLQIGHEALRALGLDRVVFMVAGSPQLKRNPVITPAEQRLAMTELAVNEEKYFEVSPLEVRRKGATYTAQTLAEIDQLGGGKDKLFFIIGMDNLSNLRSWYKPEEIIRKSTLVVVPRPDSAKVDIAQLEKDIPGITRRLKILEGPLINISASDIRRKASKGEDITCLVPHKVAEYIKQNQLYV